jgi:chaperonin GroES
LNSGEVQALDVKEGDVVVFGKYSGQNTIDIDGEELLILNESDIYGVLEA